MLFAVSSSVTISVVVGSRDFFEVKVPSAPFEDGTLHKGKSKVFREKEKEYPRVYL